MRWALPLPYQIMLGAAVGCLVVGGVLAYGSVQYRKGASDAKEQMAADFAKRQVQYRAQTDEISRAYQQERLARETLERQQNAKLDKIIAQNDVYLNRCFDHDGLQQLREAIGGNAR